MNEVKEAIEALEELGLTEYEARCFVALTQLPHGTAKEIGQVADIPRSRVYETMDRLQKKGLVEVHETDPRMYQSVSINTAIQILRKQYESYFDTVEQALQQLEPTYKEAQQGVWAINTHEQVTGRVVDLITDSRDEILLIILDEDLFDEDTRDAIAEASSREISLHLGTVSESVHERVTNMEINATAFTTDLIEWFTAMSGTPRLGRLLMVDRGPVLVSALHEEELPGVPNETAVWSDGIDHGFSTFTERVLTYELKESLEREYDE